MPYRKNVRVNVSTSHLRSIKRLLEDLEPDSEFAQQTLTRRAVAFYKEHLQNLAVIKRLEDHIEQQEAQ